MRAIWKSKVIAESDDTVVVEGNHYFPRGALVPGCFESSAYQTTCGWKGIANYFTVVVDGQRNENAAWYYADPKQAAESIRGRVAFWKGVSVVE
jgi:uncharacterized protein (DUF427 family)